MRTTTKRRSRKKPNETLLLAAEVRKQLDQRDQRIDSHDDQLGTLAEAVLALRRRVTQLERKQ